MMYPFMTLNDGTEIVHSEAYSDNGSETVKVYFEKPVYGGFHSAECYLPSYEWKNIEGFSPEKIRELQEFLESVAHIMIRLARERGFNFANAEIVEPTDEELNVMKAYHNGDPEYQPVISHEDLLKELGI